MTRVTEGHQSVEIEVGASLGSLSHVMDFEMGPDATGLTGASIPDQHGRPNPVPLGQRGRRPIPSSGPAREDSLTRHLTEAP
jgi:hypothetical protein